METRMTARATPPAQAIRRFRRRIDTWAVVKESLPPLLALSALAVTQPLLDLFGRNPEFFVASDMTKPEILLFALATALLVPLVGLAMVLVGAVCGGRRGARLVTHLLVGVLAFALGLTIARQVGVDRTVAAAGIGGLTAAVVTGLRMRSAGFRQALRYLALAPVAFVALFVVGSESSALLLDNEAAAATGVVVRRPAPVVVIVLDELPVASLMRPDGTLNEDRFPGFARLAAAGTWYRGATSVAPNTPLAVPTIVDGDLPPAGGLPTSTDHPDSLFTLLGDAYDLDVTETVTDLCPAAVCKGDEPQSTDDLLRRLGRSLTDASVVYGHASLPRRFRIDLPAVDQSWGGFIEDTGPDAFESAPPSSSDIDDGPSDETAGEFIVRQQEEREGELPDLDGETLRQAIARSSVDDDHDLLFVHEAFPHFPWVRTPTGAVYENRPGPPGSQDGTWGDNEFLVTQGLQRHLLQVGYADVALGELIDKLEADGVWDEALVVVTADHGYAFEAGQLQRSPRAENQDDVYRIPLFVKSPGGEGGVVDDRPARTMDILPTIVDLLGIETTFEFDGTSLVGADRADEAPVVYGAGPTEVAGGVEGAIASAARNGQRLPHGDDWRAVAAPGPFGALVGSPVEELGARPGPDRQWSVDQTGQLESVDPGAVVPLILTGEIDPGGEPGATLLVAVNGTVAGVVGFEEQAGLGPFSVLLDESAFIEGRNEVELLAVTGSPAEPRVRSLGPPG
jgi:hypothetical protein